MNLFKQLKSKPSYKWVIVAASFLMVMTCLGFCSSNKGLYLAAITQALNIKRSLFSINDSCRYVATAVVNLFFGILVARYGPRKLIAAGFICLIAAMLVYSFAEGIFTFYIGGFLLGLGLSWTSTTMVGYVVNRWCSEKKGTIMGMILASNGIGGVIAVQITAPIIDSAVFGYRRSYQLVAVLLMIVGTVIFLLFKDAPEKVSVPAAQVKKEKKPIWTGLSFGQCLRKPYFYIACVCIFFTGLVLQSVSGVASAHMKDVGMGADYIASVLSVYSLSLTLFKFLAGFSHDKLGLRTTLSICYVASLVMCACLAFLSNTSEGMILAMSYAVICGISLPLETIMLPLITADLFGQRDYAKILGIFVSVNTAGYAVGAPVTNLFFDIFGTYRHVFLIFCGIMAVVTVVFQFVLNAARKCGTQLESGTAGGYNS